MQKYIGTKLIEAKPMTRGEYNKFRGWVLPEGENPEDKGYLVKYSDDYVSWSPKSVFESAYFKVIKDKNSSETGICVSEKMAEEFVSYYDTSTIGDCTTVVRCVLRNGFEIIESSTCVAPENYSQEVGEDICLEKIREKIYELLAFLLKTGLNGIR